MSNNSLVNLGDLAAPADTLIKKVSGALGGYFRPYQIKRVAKAEAEAALIKAQSEIEIGDLHRRAMHRFVQEEAKKQENIESITNASLPQLNEQSKPQNVEDDWLTNFFDKCRIVSDTEMQALWSKVLAGEANNPGTFSKRAIDFLGSLDKFDAECFQKLMAFAWDLGELDPLVYDIEAAIYKENGITFSLLSHLNSIGLISFEPTLGGFRRYGYEKKGVIIYSGKPYLLEFPKDKENEIRTGKVMLTTLGRQLAKILSLKPVPGFDAYVIDQLTKQQIKTAPLI